MNIRTPRNQILFALRGYSLDDVKINWNLFADKNIDPKAALRDDYYLGKYGCFSPFISSFDFHLKCNTFYVSFPYCRRWYRTLIDQINSTLKFIKISIVDERSFIGSVTQNDCWNDYQLVLRKVDGAKLNYLYYCPLLEITFDERYSSESVSYFGYSLVTLIRMASICERFVPLDSTYRTVGGNIIEYLININNSLYRDQRYRTWTEYTNVSIKDLLRFNIIEGVNRAANYLSNYTEGTRQSGIIERLRSYTKNIIPLEDLPPVLTRE